MEEENVGAGVQGSSRTRGKSATQERPKVKKGSIKVALIVMGIIVVLGIGLSLAKAELGIWGWLVVAVILSVIASRLENPQVTYSSALRTMSWVIVGTLLLNTGIGMWTKSLVLDTNTWFECRSDLVACNAKKDAIEEELQAACEANSFQEKCVALKENGGQNGFVQPAPEATHALTEPCKGEYAKLKGCELVIFRGDPYLRTAKHNQCIDHHPNPSTLSKRPLGEGEWEYTARKGARIYLFDLDIGERFKGNPCG